MVHAFYGVLHRSLNVSSSRGPTGPRPFSKKQNPPITRHILGALPPNGSSMWRRQLGLPYADWSLAQFDVICSQSTLVLLLSVAMLDLEGDAIESHFLESTTIDQQS